jgi:hypothetical protein
MAGTDYTQAIEESTMPHMTWVSTNPRSTSKLYAFIAAISGPGNNFGYGPNPNAVWLGILCRMLNRLD